MKITETGLPTGANWSAVIHSLDLTTLGQSYSIRLNSTATTDSAALTNGTWNVYFSTTGGFVPSTHAVSVLIGGTGATLSVAFSRLFKVTFSEAHLPSGTRWSVDFDGMIQVATVSTIVFSATNGTLFYQIGKVPGHVSTPLSGSVLISGKNLTTAVKFA